ncbi:hypothetical protein [Pseudoalteromonas rubra]|uniref:hypothetical protein n=1 Tax=Pseudoalteromonas rubra TaxID=43658 RepID=UPI000F77CE20|nr:hypothetical protein [Pseudoalteromonas rubra]
MKAFTFVSLFLFKLLILFSYEANAIEATSSFSFSLSENTKPNLVLASSFTVTSHQYLNADFHTPKSKPSFAIKVTAKNLDYGNLSSTQKKFSYVPSYDYSGGYTVIYEPVSNVFYFNSDYNDAQHSYSNNFPNLSINDHPLFHFQSFKKQTNSFLNDNQEHMNYTITDEGFNLENLISLEGNGYLYTALNNINFDLNASKLPIWKHVTLLENNYFSETVEDISRYKVVLSYALDFKCDYFVFNRCFKSGFNEIYNSKNEREVNRNLLSFSNSGFKGFLLWKILEKRRCKIT